jgi:transcriptional regulator with XRE-family HTH domain
MTNIGENICTRRKELGMTQEELAKKMGYKSKSTINKIENGTNDIPQSKIVKFAETLETTPAYLMGWQKVEKNNDTIADIIVRMRNDDFFLSVVEDISKLDSEKLTALKQMLSTFLK